MGHSNQKQTSWVQIKMYLFKTWFWGHRMITRLSNNTSGMEWTSSLWKQRISRLHHQKLGWTVWSLEHRAEAVDEPWKSSVYQTLKKSYNFFKSWSLRQSKRTAKRPTLVSPIKKNPGWASKIRSSFPRLNKTWSMLRNNQASYNKDKKYFQIIRQFRLTAMIKLLRVEDNKRIRKRIWRKVLNPVHQTQS